MKTIQNKAVMLGIAAILGLAPVGARAGEILPAVTGHGKNNRPERPEKPDKNKEDRPNLTEIQDVVKSFQDQKKEFIKQQVEAKKAAAEEERRRLKELKISGDIGAQVKQELKDSVESAKKQAAEQARKLAEEAAAAAKENRRKD